MGEILDCFCKGIYNSLNYISQTKPSQIPRLSPIDIPLIVEIMSYHRSMSKSLLSSRSTILIFSVASSLFESVMHSKAFGKLVSFEMERFRGGRLLHAGRLLERGISTNQCEKKCDS